MLLNKVCRIIVDEFEKEVSEIDPKKKIEIGQYRLDSKGNTLHKQVKYFYSFFQ
jgi:hypothetical protein